MSAVWLWVRADLRRRWRSWVVLGLLAGISVGLACAAIAGARRTERALPTFERAGQLPDAAVLPNDPAFDAAKQQAVADLPEVTATAPFLVPFLLRVADPAGAESGLLPIGAYSAGRFVKPLVDGRVADPHRADEIVVNENMRDRYGLDIGSTMTYVQHAIPPGASLPPELLPSGDPRIRQKLRVVGISKAVDNNVDSTPSAGFYRKYRDRLVGVTNEFVDLRRGPADFTKFQADVQKIMGHPVNVTRAESLFGVAKVSNVSDVEQGGLLLFALAVLVGAGALVGQALVRAVTAGASDLPVWRAIGADRRVVVRAMVLPTLVTAAVGAVVSIVVAVALSPRFPIALTRNYELDIGLHADWLVLGLGALGLVVAVLVTAWATAEIRVRRRMVDAAAGVGRGAARDDGRALAAVAHRFATGGRARPGPARGAGALRDDRRDRRSPRRRRLPHVPGRTVRHGRRPGPLGRRVGPNLRGVGEPSRPPNERRCRTTRQSPRPWTHSGPVPCASTGGPRPTWGTAPVNGRINLVVLDGHAPEGRREIALAPTTMQDLGLHLGDDGPGG